MRFFVVRSACLIALHVCACFCLGIITTDAHAASASAGDVSTRLLIEIDRCLQEDAISQEVQSFAEFVEMFLEPAIVKSKTFRGLVARRSRPIFLEWLRNPSLKIRLAGIYGVRELDNTIPPEALIYFVLASPCDIEIIRALHVENLLGTEKLFDAMVNHLRQIPIENIGTAELTVALEVTGLSHLLEDWYHRGGRKQIPISAQAWIANLILEQRAFRRVRESDELVEDLQTFKQYDGLPRLVYTRWGSPTEDGYMSAMKAALAYVPAPCSKIGESSYNSFLALIIIKNRSVVARFLELDDIDMPKERRDMLRPLLLDDENAVEDAGMGEESGANGVGMSGGQMIDDAFRRLGQCD